MNVRNYSIFGLAALAFVKTGCGSTDTAPPALTTSVERTLDTPTPLRTTTIAPATTQSAAAVNPTAAASPPPTSMPRNTPAGLISEATWPGEWPFTVTEGVLMCGTPSQVSFTADRVMYALNGAAMAAGGLKDVNAIWKDSSYAGVKVSMGPMIEKGLAFC